MTTDYRRSVQHHKDTWYGFKRYAKRALTIRPVNAALVAVSRRWVPMDVAARLPVRGKEVVGRAAGASFAMLDPGQCTVAKELFWGNGVRPKAREALALELFAQLAKTSDVVLDIGAYTGIFTLAATAANPALEAHAFELVPEIFRLLFDNCVRNDVLVRTTCHHCGIGRPGHSIVVPGRWDGTSLPSSVAAGMTFADGVRVPFRALDDVVHGLRAGSRVLAKIDVEGSEDDVLRHAPRLLAEFRPDMLCEVLPQASTAQELETLLTPHGYRFYRVEDHALRLLPSIQPQRDYWDWFFTARPESELRASVVIAD